MGGVEGPPTSAGSRAERRLASLQFDRWLLPRKGSEHALVSTTAVREPHQFLAALKLTGPNGGIFAKVVARD